MQMKLQVNKPQTKQIDENLLEITKQKYISSENVNKGLLNLE